MRSPPQVSRALPRLLLPHLDHGDRPLVFGIDETLDSPHHSHVLNCGESQWLQRETAGGILPVATASRRFAGGGRRQLSGLRKSLSDDRVGQFQLSGKEKRNLPGQLTIGDTG